MFLSMQFQISVSNTTNGAQGLAIFETAANSVSTRIIINYQEFSFKYFRYTL